MVNLRATIHWHPIPHYSTRAVIRLFPPQQDACEHYFLCVGHAAQSDSSASAYWHLSLGAANSRPQQQQPTNQSTNQQQQQQTTTTTNNNCSSSSNTTTIANKQTNQQQTQITNNTKQQTDNKQQTTTTPTTPTPTNNNNGNTSSTVVSMAHVRAIDWILAYCANVAANFTAVADVHVDPHTRELARELHSELMQWCVSEVLRNRDIFAVLSHVRVRHAAQFEGGDDDGAARSVPRSSTGPAQQSGLQPLSEEEVYYIAGFMRMLTRYGMALQGDAAAQVIAF